MMLLAVKLLSFVSAISLLPDGKLVHYNRKKTLAQLHLNSGDGTEWWTNGEDAIRFPGQKASRRCLQSPWALLLHDIARTRTARTTWQ